MIIITKTVSYANCSQLQWIELNVVQISVKDQQPRLALRMHMHALRFLPIK